MTPPPPAYELRTGTPADVEQCVTVWIEACADRDGRHVDGVAERARAKFDHARAWVVATDGAGDVVGFALGTPHRGGRRSRTRCCGATPRPTCATWRDP